MLRRLENPHSRLISQRLQSLTRSPISGANVGVPGGSSRLTASRIGSGKRRQNNIGATQQFYGAIGALGVWLLKWWHGGTLGAAWANRDLARRK